MSVTIFSLLSCKIQTLISSCEMTSPQKTIFTMLILGLLPSSFIFTRVCTFHKRSLFTLSHIITLVSLHSVLKSLKICCEKNFSILQYVVTGNKILHIFVDSFIHILYQSCYCGLFLWSFQFRTSTYEQREKATIRSDCGLFVWSFKVKYSVSQLLL